MQRVSQKSASDPGTSQNTGRFAPGLKLAANRAPTAKATASPGCDFSSHR